MEKTNERFMLPKIGQIGVVVKDLDSAVKYYSEVLGLGPFRIADERDIPDTTYRGQKHPLKLKQAWVLMGEVELELIQVLGGDSTHTEFLATKGEGLHHLGFFVEDLEKELAKAKKQGIGVIQSGKIEGGGFVYLDTVDIAGVIFELVQRKSFWAEND
jgi:methylmalonyl-CoA epimerase